MLVDMACEPTERELAALGRVLAWAVEEDLGTGDVTGSLVAETMTARGQFSPRQAITVCGTSMLGRIASAYSGEIRTTVLAGDGQHVQAGDALGRWDGPARAILAAERVALNFLQHLSGIATATRRFVQAAEGRAEIYDTRKTTPAWRVLEKYAVRAGGGRNHRMGLYDAILVKDNHIAALARTGLEDPLGEIASGLARARGRLGAGGFVEIEVDELSQLQIALGMDVDVILLDNMTPAELAEAVALRDRAGLRGRVALEASGQVTAENIDQIAETGVERIAVGAITHSAAAVDIGLDMTFD